MSSIPLKDYDFEMAVARHQPIDYWFNQVRFLVGNDHMPFIVHYGPLKGSEYLMKALNQRWGGPNRVIDLTDQSPAIFERYVEWCYTGQLMSMLGVMPGARIPLDMEDGWLGLIVKLYQLGTYLEDAKLQEAIKSVMQHRSFGDTPPQLTRDTANRLIMCNCTGLLEIALDRIIEHEGPTELLEKDPNGVTYPAQFMDMLWRRAAFKYRPLKRKFDETQMAQDATKPPPPSATGLMPGNRGDWANIPRSQAPTVGAVMRAMPR